MTVKAFAKGEVEFDSVSEDTRKAFIRIAPSFLSNRERGGHPVHVYTAQTVGKFLGWTEKDGCDRKSLMYKDNNQTATISVCFADDTAQKIGLGPRSIYRLIRISKNIGHDLKAEIRNTCLAFELRNLLKLARIKDHKEQRAAALAYISGEVDTIVVPKKRPPTRTERQQAAEELAEILVEHIPSELWPREGTRKSRLHDVTVKKLKDFKVTKMQSSRWQEVATVPEPEFEAWLAEHKDGAAPTSAGLRRLAKQDDIAQLDEWLKQAAALETYLRGKEMQRPMMGAQRRIEARIGQLLGPAEKQKGGRGKTVPHEGQLKRNDRSAFRHLAKAVNGECVVSSDEWRTSRRALVTLVRNRTPKSPEKSVPAETTTNWGTGISVPDGKTAESLCRDAAYRYQVMSQASAQT